MNYDTIQKIWESNNVFEKLRDRYIFNIKRDFDYNVIVKEISESDYVLNEHEVEEHNQTPIRATYIGNHLAMVPSGKYYMPWCSNQTYKDEWKDNAWFEALELVLEQYGMFWQSGEGSATDIFFCKSDE